MPLEADIQAEIARAIEGVGPLATPLRGLIRREMVAEGQDTQQSIGSAIAAAKDAMWPVGSIYIGVTSTNPNTLLGFGTWTAFGAGRTLVGLDSGDPDWDTVEETRGSKTHTLVTGEMPVHTHVQDAHTHTQNSHNHTQDSHNHGAGDMYTPSRNENSAGTSDHAQESLNTGSGQIPIQGLSSTVTATNQAATATNQNATATNQNTGGGGAHANIQPSIVVYFFKRTA